MFAFLGCRRLGGVSRSGEGGGGGRGAAARKKIVGGQRNRAIFFGGQGAIGEEEVTPHAEALAFVVWGAFFVRNAAELSAISACIIS